MSRKTSEFSRYDFDPIKEEDILIDEFRTAIKKYEANARVTRVMLPAAVLAVGADYIIKTLIYKGAENFYLTRPGIFLGMVALVCFTIFVIFAIRQHNILKDKWVCPRCGQVLPYSGKRSSAPAATATKISSTSATTKAFSSASWTTAR